jgi:PAS domain S-box-containing protein
MSQFKIETLQMNNHYKDLYQYSNDAIIIHSLEGEIYMANPRAEEMFGCNEEALIGCYIYHVASVQDASKFEESIKILKGKGFHSVTCNLTEKDETVFSVDISLSLMKMDEGDFVQAIIRDLTAEKKMLKTLKRTNEELNKRKKDLLEAQKIAKIGNWQYDVVSNSITWSREVYRIFELDPDRFEATYEAFLEAIHPEDVARVDGAYGKSLQTKTPYHEIFRLVTYKGIKHVEDRCKHIYDDEGNIVRSIGLIQDITEFVEKEEQIKEQEEIMIFQSRHAAMGEMIGMIAHQWRQPISVVGLLTETIQHGLKANPIQLEMIEKDLEQVSKQIHYMSNTIEDFKNFFQKSDKVDKVHVPTLLNEVNTMLGAVLQRHEITLITHCDASISLHTYSRELLQVIMSIVTNAKDVLEKAQGKKEIIINVQEIEDKVQIKIFNNGSSIGEPIIYKIFEPYFTTKSNSGGTGLGLYMVKTIVDKHIQGTISVDNLEDGVEFTIMLPKKLEEE